MNLTITRYSDAGGQNDIHFPKITNPPLLKVKLKLTHSKYLILPPP